LLKETNSNLFWFKEHNVFNITQRKDRKRERGKERKKEREKERKREREKEGKREKVKERKRGRHFYIFRLFCAT
jgi:hypothetical protein